MNEMTMHLGDRANEIKNGVAEAFRDCLFHKLLFVLK